MFIQVERVPVPGEIVHAASSWECAGGGGAGAAVQLAKLCDEAHFFTAVGDDPIGRRAVRQLVEMGVRVHAAVRAEPTRQAVTHIDADGERTITVLGTRLEPLGTDSLPWSEIEGCEAGYFTAGDAAALAHARKADRLVATSRVLGALEEGAVFLDALVGSASDPSEAYADGDLVPAPGLVVRTEGELGGSYAAAGEPVRRYDPVSPARPVVDRYGAGDSFAAGLAFALGRGDAAADAVAFAAACGAAVVTGPGPYEGQLGRSHR